MLTQQEWVEGCYAYYAENGYEPGNPEDGIWEDAHYPVPKCKGGSETIKLLKQHHAVQGVLQSEEYQWPCIWGWEADYLEGEMLELCKKWITGEGRSLTCKLAHSRKTSEERREIALRSAAAQTPEQRSAAVRKGKASMTPEQRSEAARLGRASMTPEVRRDISLRAAAAQTPEQRSEAVRRGRARMTPERRREIGIKAAETRRRKREAAMLQSVTAP